MKELIKKHRSLWSQRVFLAHVTAGLLLLVASVVATYFANSYATIRASNSVTDIILDNIPIVDVRFVFNEGAILFLVLVVCVLLYKPQKIPFVIKSIALFTVIRSLFMVLTHLAPPISKSYLDATDLIFKISSGDDLFFSAHTGLPFLMGIMFWNDKYLRYVFLLATVIGGGSVLLGHLHYSIDVFSALFIAFGVYYIARYLFRKDFVLFDGTKQASASL